MSADKPPSWLACLACLPLIRERISQWPEPWAQELLACIEDMLENKRARAESADNARRIRSERRRQERLLVAEDILRMRPGLEQHELASSVKRRTGGRLSIIREEIEPLFQKPDTFGSERIHGTRYASTIAST